MSIDTVHARDGALTPGGPLQEKQQANANFGCAMGLAKLALPTSALDDVLISATSETVRILNPPTTFADNGAVYSYKSDALGQLSAGPLRFEPGALESGQRCGNLGMASGRILSTHSYNLQFAGAYRRDLTLNGNLLPNVGAVDVYRTSGTSTPAAPIFPQPIRPPLNPNTGQVEPEQNFGYSLAVADVNGDGNNDLIASAHGVDRVIVFWASPFLTHGFDPMATEMPCTILTPPNPQSQGISGSFGVWLDTGDVDNDGKADILVGEPRWSATAAQERYGRAHLFLGKDVSEPIASLNVIFNFGPMTTFNTPTPIAGQIMEGWNYGWYLWLMDVNGDGKDEAVIHAESPKWPGAASGTVIKGTNASNTDIRATGNVCIYVNQGAAPHFTTQPQVQLYSPKPQAERRFGKHVQNIQWRNDSLPPPNNMKRALLITEPESDYVSSGFGLSASKAGSVMLYFWDELAALTPAPTSMLPSWQVFSEDGGVSLFNYPTINARPEEDDLFGRWMVAGDFGNFTSGASQFVIAASGKSVPEPTNLSNPLLHAGAAAHLRQP